MKILNLHKLGGVLPPNSIYIGNKNTQYGLAKSKFANPYYLENWFRTKKIQAFEEYFKQAISDGSITEQDLLDLYGKDLVCFCSPKPCHGNVVRKYVAMAYFNHQSKQKDL